MIQWLSGRKTLIGSLILSLLGACWSLDTLINGHADQGHRGTCGDTSRLVCSRDIPVRQGVSSNPRASRLGISRGSHPVP
jgi:hypothetical protein